MTRSAKHLSPQDLKSENSVDEVSMRARARGSNLQRISLAIMAAAVLALAPNPAFGQRGSGGGGGSHGSSGGGGSHSSVGSGGGSHASSDSGGSSHGSSGSASSSSSHPSVWSRIFHHGSGSASAGNRGKSTGASGAASGSAAAGSSVRGSAPPTSVHFGPSSAASGNGSAISEPAPAPKHTTIGFPPVGSGQLTKFQLTRSGPMSFSGQGNEIWQEEGLARPTQVALGRSDERSDGPVKLGTQQALGGQQHMMTPPPRPAAPQTPAATGTQTARPVAPPVGQTPLPSAPISPRTPSAGFNVRLLNPPASAPVQSFIRLRVPVITLAGSGIALLSAPTPPRVFPPRRPPVIYPGYPIFGAGFYGFGWGWPFFGLGWGSSCWGDPFWSWNLFSPCNGYYGGYNNYYPSGPLYNDQPDTNVEPSQENGWFPWQNNPATTDDSQSNNSAAEQAQRGETGNEVVLYLTDGTVHVVGDYWVADGRLHYKTSDGAENVIEMSQLDLQRTVDVNASRGVDFTLRPAPDSIKAPDQSPAVNPQQQQPDAQSPAPSDQQ